MKYWALRIICFAALAVASEVSCSQSLLGRLCSEAQAGLRRGAALIPLSLFKACLRHRESVYRDYILPLTASASEAHREHSWAPKFNKGRDINQF